MRATGRDVEENAARLKREVALAVDVEVVLGTPVDTGRARSNWQVELNGPAQGTVETLGGVRKGFKGSGGAVAQRSIEKAKARIEQAGPEVAIHITNNLSYIGRLNEGWSAQAPAGFVETAVLNGAARVKRARLLVSKNDKLIGGDTGPIG